MVRRYFASATVVVTLAASFAGCAGGAPFQAFRSDNPTFTGGPVPAADVARKDATAKDAAFGPPRVEQEPSGISGAFQNVSSKVASALTIKPKVVPAQDPISLSTQPGKLGPEFYLAAAQIHENRGDVDAAKQQYQKALEAAPDDLTALVGCARLFDRQDEFAEAEKYYRRAVTAHPDSGLARNDLALCYARQEKLEPAINEMRTAVRIVPDKKLYRNNLAAMLVQVGRLDEAYDHLSVAHSPAVAHYNLGYLLYQGNDRVGAQRHFALALEADPSLTPARQMLDQLSARPSPNRQSNKPASAPPSHREQPSPTQLAGVTEPMAQTAMVATKQPPAKPVRLLPPVENAESPAEFRNGFAE